MVQGFARNEAGDFPGCVVRGVGWSGEGTLQWRTDDPLASHSPPSLPSPGRTLDSSGLADWLWLADRAGFRVRADWRVKLGSDVLAWTPPASRSNHQQQFASPDNKLQLLSRSQSSSFLHARGHAMCHTDLPPESARSARVTPSRQARSTCSWPTLEAPRRATASGLLPEDGPSCETSRPKSGCRLSNELVLMSIAILEMLSQHVPGASHTQHPSPKRRESSG